MWLSHIVLSLTLFAADCFCTQLQAFKGNAIHPFIPAQTSAQTVSQLQCILKHRLDHSKYWLIEAKQIKSDQWLCRYFILINYDDVQKLFTEDVTSTVYARVSVRELKQNIHEATPPAESTSETQPPSTPASSCKVLKDNDDKKSSENGRGGNIQSGVYQIKIGEQTKSVYCDMMNNGGGWTLIQRRVDKKNFYRGWDDYKKGFGDPTRSYWLGLEAINQMTKKGNTLIRLEGYRKDNQEHLYAIHERFKVENETCQYRVHVGGYLSGSSDSVSEDVALMNSAAFSTLDNDNDAWFDSCAQKWHAGWWFNSCCHINANGVFLNQGDEWQRNAILWGDALMMSFSIALKEVEAPTLIP
ncbi:techylectin-5A-like [Clytia hemisphaerica]|uniref:Fibrinogen C-terminal domain-containing protein n=1 Tax=Clytia hemisphaerica TaxID=252671 RepID=A0A7M5VCG6_9CNID